MIVPNYIPEPLEVPGNVTELPYLARLRFVRTVTILFLLSVVSVELLLYLPLPKIGPGPSLLVLTGILVALEVWRIGTRGRALEGKVSSAALPAVLVAVAMVLNELRAMGLPIWQGLAAPICLTLYTIFSRRDYSFVGNFLLSLIASSVVVAAICDLNGLTAAHSTIALLTNGVLCGYFVYDLASILSRRRRGEELAAVTDLYRDVFNIFGYLVRVAKHWQKHRLLSMPTTFELIKKGKG